MVFGVAPFSSVAYNSMQNHSEVPKLMPLDHHPSHERRRWRELVQLLGPDIAPTALQLMEEMRLVAHALNRSARTAWPAPGSPTPSTAYS